jgi:type I restriction-modification system DNA methylase subunit
MPDSEEAVKAGIKKLIDDYYQYRNQNLSEGAVETKLILPLFRLLEWDIEHDVVPKETIQRKDSKGIPDFSFKLNNSVAFYLEAKRLDPKKQYANLSEDEAKQAISYSISKRVPFAILTNFEEIKVFCAEEDNAYRKPFKRFKCEEFIDRFAELSLLSKPAFIENKLLQVATDEGRLKERRKFDSILLADLMLIRKKLAANIEKRYPNHYNTEERDEIVQRIMDRLIFMRKCEDTQNNVGTFILSDLVGVADSRVYSKLKERFTEFNDAFDSGLFKPNYDNDCDNIALDGEVIRDLITLFYESRDKQYLYDFDWIDADVLGQVYEQYLSLVLVETASGRTKLKGGKPQKKEQGIYYTPVSVVEYIVKETLGELLKDTKAEDIKNVKVLDPACGSGSFLIKAFDEIRGAYRQKGGQQLMNLDSLILTNNLFGVDLDEKAVEISRLNLLLKASETKHKLPELGNNMKMGNSLIEDKAVTPQAFDWNTNFKDILGNGGFDIIIGNPPYGAELPDADLDYLSKLKTSKIRNSDTYIFFIENCIKLLKEGGLFGFIIPDTFLRKSDLISLREVILNNFKVKIIAEVGAVFGDAKVTENVIFIFQKCSNEKKRQDNQLTYCTLNKNLPREERLQLISRGIWESQGKIIQKNWANAPEMRLGRFNSPKLLAIIDKIERGTSLGEIKGIDISRGSEGGKEQISPTKVSDDYKPIVIPDDIWKYGLKFSGKYFQIRDAENEKYSKEKLLVIRIRNTRLKDRIVAAYDDTGIYTLKTLQMIYPDGTGDVNLKYLLGVINSKLMNFYCQHYLSDDINKKYLQGLKIVIPEKGMHSLVVAAVDRMLSLNKKLGELGGKITPETARVNEDINKTYAEIDDLVYSIYGIKEERKIIEEILKT